MVDFESTLERDFATLLEFDDLVESYDAQPLRMQYVHEGRRRPGWPDFLVKYRVETGKSPCLYDVKYRDELFTLWPELKPRLKAAKAYAVSLGWSYHIVTEVEIRTPFLSNARFLLPYRNRSYSKGDEARLLAVLRTLSDATPRKLLDACECDPNREALLVPALWSLVARYLIDAELNEPLNMNTRIKCKALS